MASQSPCYYIIPCTFAGECTCAGEYFGYNCALNRSTIPDIEQTAFIGESDISKRPCRTFTMPGQNFGKG